MTVVLAFFKEQRNAQLTPQEMREQDFGASTFEDPNRNVLELWGNSDRSSCSSQDEPILKPTGIVFPPRPFLSGLLRFAND